MWPAQDNQEKGQAMKSEDVAKIIRGLNVRGRGLKRDLLEGNYCEAEGDLDTIRQLLVQDGCPETQVDEFMDEFIHSSMDDFDRSSYNPRY